MTVDIRKYQTTDGTIPLDDRLSGLRDKRAIARILVRLDRLALGLGGQWRAVGQGIRELKIPEGKGYCVYYGWDGPSVAISRPNEPTSPRRRPTGVTTMSASEPYKPYRTADYLRTPEEAAEYLNAAIEDGDPTVLLRALRNVADSAGGMSHLARRTGLSRESLYKSLSEDGNPRLSSLEAILRALGLRLSVQPLPKVSSDGNEIEDTRT